MAKTKRLMVVVCVVAASVVLSLPGVAEEQDNWAFSLGAGLVFDDNRDGTDGDKEALLEGRIVPKATFSLTDARNKMALAYSPSFRYRDNPRYNQNETELYHDLVLSGERKVSRRLWVAAREQFNSTDDPAIMESGRTFRENASYWLNRVGVSVRYNVLPGRLLTTVRGSHQIKRYDDDDFAEIADQDGIGAELSMRYVLSAQTAVLGDVSYGVTELGSEYVGGDRGSQVLFAGVGAERTMSAWSVKGRVGADMVTYDNASIDTATRPAADAHMIYRPTEKTALDLAVRYHVVRGDISPYASQSRASVVLTAGHKLRESLSVSVSGIFARGSYDADTVALDAAGSPVDSSKVDGVDSLAAVNLGCTYKLPFRGVSLVGGYGFESWDADDHIRTSHRRNTVNLSLLAEF